MATEILIVDDNSDIRNILNELIIDDYQIDKTNIPDGDNFKLRTTGIGELEGLIYDYNLNFLIITLKAS